MRWFCVLLVIIILIPIAAFPAFADGINIIDLVKANGIIAGVAIAAILFLFRYIPNEKLYAVVRGLFRKIGIAMTFGLSRYKWSAPIWNKTLEPWFIDLISNTFLAAIDGLVAGLKSDNMSKK